MLSSVVWASEDRLCSSLSCLDTGREAGREGTAVSDSSRSSSEFSCNVGRVVLWTSWDWNTGGSSSRLDWLAEVFGAEGGGGCARLLVSLIPLVESLVWSPAAGAELEGLERALDNPARVEAKL